MNATIWESKMAGKSIAGMLATNKARKWAQKRPESKQVRKDKDMQAKARKPLGKKIMLVSTLKECLKLIKQESKL